MRLLIGLIIVVYLIGVGVALAPVFQTQGEGGTTSQLSARLMQAAPDALAWPVAYYRRMSGQPDAAAVKTP